MLLHVGQPAQRVYLLFVASQESRNRSYQSSSAHNQPAHSYADMNDVDVFDEIDVDALVASHQQQKQPRPSNTFNDFPAREPEQQHTSRNAPTSAINEPGGGAAKSAQRAEALRLSIKETRKILRDVRDGCDDASLEGEIPYELQRKRDQLEQKLESLSRQYRECNSTASTPSEQSRPSSFQPESRYVMPSPVVSPAPNGEDSSNPRCSCGLLTTEAQVQHGANAKRIYNKCTNCGFHSWANGSESVQDSSRAATTYSKPVVAPEQPCVSSDPRVTAKLQRAKRVLRDVFGHNAFRPGQERVVMESFSGRDVFVLMPTGGGKSLCYQLPACVDDGVTIVISPLVSLIQDQVQQLQALDVGVAHLNGEQDYETEQKPIISELFSSRIRIKLLYVTPEKIASSNSLNNIFESLQKRGLLARFVIDEAHCISQWGHDFRKDYMNLGQLRNKFPTVSEPTCGCLS